MTTGGYITNRHVRRIIWQVDGFLMFSQLLGFCWQNELNTADLKTRGLTMVTEIGSALDVITLLQLPWQERFRVRIFDPICIFVFFFKQNAMKGKTKAQDIVN